MDECGLELCPGLQLRYLLFQVAYHRLHESMPRGAELFLQMQREAHLREIHSRRFR